MGKSLEIPRKLTNASNRMREQKWSSAPVPLLALVGVLLLNCHFVNIVKFAEARGAHPNARLAPHTHPNWPRNFGHRLEIAPLHYHHHGSSVGLAGRSGGSHNSMSPGAPHPTFNIPQPAWTSQPYGPHSPPGSHASWSSSFVHTLPRGPMSSPTIEPPFPSSANPSFASTPAPVSASAVSGDRPLVNLTEVCAHVSNTAERQLLAYVSSIESITGTIQELDEVVQQMRPKSCESHEVSSPSTTSTSTTTQSPMYIDDVVASSGHFDSQPDAPPFAPDMAPNVESVIQPLIISSSMSSTPTPTPTTTPAPASAQPSESSLTTTESFFDTTNGPITSEAPSAMLNIEERVRGRSRRGEHVGEHVDGEPHFGAPVAHAPSQDPTGDDLAKASEDLRALRRDLSSTAEMLRQTNHTVHSALLRALLSYVSSIERRIDTQRQLHLQARATALLKLKISLIKEKMAVLLEKLKSFIPFGHHSGDGSGSGSGDSIGSTSNTSHVGNTIVVNDPLNRVPHNV